MRVLVMSYPQGRTLKGVHRHLAKVIRKTCIGCWVRSIFMENLFLKQEPHSTSDTYSIGIIIESDGHTRKCLFIRKIISHVLSFDHLNYQALWLILPLRNPYEQSLARQLILFKHKYLNVKIEVLLSDYQYNRFLRWRNDICQCKYSDIIGFADKYTIIHTAFPTDFFRQVSNRMAQQCNQIVYALNNEWQETLLKAICRLIIVKK